MGFSQYGLGTRGDYLMRLAWTCSCALESRLAPAVAFTLTLPYLHLYFRLRLLYYSPKYLTSGTRCPCDRLEGNRPCAPCMARRVLIPCVAPDPRVETRDEVSREARLWNATRIAPAVPKADRDLLPVADHDLAVAAEVVDATVAGVTAERPAQKAPRGAQK